MLSSALNRCCLLLACVTFAVPPPAIAETVGSTTKVKAARFWAIRRQPEQLVNGSPIVIAVVPPVRLTALSAMWLEHDVLFSYDPASKTWYGIAGVSLETRPGILRSEVKGHDFQISRHHVFPKYQGPGGEISQHRGDRGQAIHRTQQGTTATHSAGQGGQARRV